MFALSGTIGHNLRPFAVFLILFLSIIVFVPSELHSQTGHNQVKLIWTASGDDSFLGQASFYDIRFSTKPVGTDTAFWWQSATLAKNLPTPSRAGRKDSCIIKNLLIDQHYYFAIRVADEAYNWSNIVNIAEIPQISCADVNGDLSFDNIDLAYLLSFLYGNGPPPPLPEGGDVDNSGNINVADAMYMINYRLNSGPPPDCED